MKHLLWMGIPTALNAASWTLLSMGQWRQGADVVFVALSAFVAWVYYARDRLNPTRADFINNNERVEWYGKYMKKPYWVVVGICLLLVMVKFQVIPFLLVGMLLAFGYTKSFQVGGKSFCVKNVFLGKVILVPVLWLWLTVFTPAFYYSAQVGLYGLMAISVYIFLIIAIQVIVNDIDDIAGDQNEGVKSIPVVLGVHKTKAVLLVLVLGSVLVGLKCFPLINLVVYTLLLLTVIVPYHTSASYGLKLLNVSLGLAAYPILTLHISL